MVNHLKDPAAPFEVRQRRRSVWRQRLVDAERGITHGFRLDSTLFVHIFMGCIVIATAFVLGIGVLEWVLVILALTMALSAEMFNQVLKAIWHTVGHHFDGPVRSAVRIGTAAVFVTILGAVSAIGLVFGSRLLQILAD